MDYEVDRVDGLVSVEEAKARLLAGATPSPVEEMALSSCQGMVAARDLVACVDTPPFDRAMLDGYAVRAEDVEGVTRDTPRMLRVIGEMMAGANVSTKLGPREAVRTMTGAPLARGADAIVRLEWTEMKVATESDGQGDLVQVLKGVSAGEAVQRQGEGTHTGSLIVRAGERMTPLRLGALASQGVRTVTVFAKPTVGVMSVGDELVKPGSALNYGQIYDSNSVLLAALASAAGGQPQVYEPCRDDEAAMVVAFATALETCDLLITAGGVSVGDRDLTPRVLESMGAVRLFWGIWMRPGTPVYACTLHGKTVIACSGNPFAAWVNAVVLAWPLIERLGGLVSTRQWRVRARLIHVPTLRPLRHARYLGASLSRDLEGSWVADLSGSHSSGLLPAGGDHAGLAALPPGFEAADGAEVDVLMTPV